MKHLTTFIRLVFLGLFFYLIFTGKMMLWLILFGTSLILAPIFGRFYCGYMCPMNTLMIPVEKMSKKLKIQTDKTPNWLASGYLGWLFLVISIALMIISKKIIHKNIPILLIWLGIAVLVTLRYKPEVFHNYICPFGVLQKTFGRFTLLGNRIDDDKCINCKFCTKNCPTNAINVNGNKLTINIKNCIECNNCKTLCPKNAIEYKKL